jgi:hypothetical protein
VPAKHLQHSPTRDSFEDIAAIEPSYSHIKNSARHGRSLTTAANGLSTLGSIVLFVCFRSAPPTITSAPTWTISFLIFADRGAVLPQMEAKFAPTFTPCGASCLARGLEDERFAGFNLDLQAPIPSPSSSVPLSLLVVRGNIVSGCLRLQRFRDSRKSPSKAGWPAVSATVARRSVQSGRVPARGRIETIQRHCHESKSSTDVRIRYARTLPY